MEEKIKNISKVIIVLFAIYGGLQFVNYCYDVFKSLTDDMYTYKKNSEKVLEQVSNVYKLGVFFGDDAAKGYESEVYDGYSLKKLNSLGEAQDVAIELLTSRVNDFVCVGPHEGDCNEMPTVEELRTSYTLHKENQYNDETLTVRAFASGYLDGFTSYYGY